MNSVNILPANFYVLRLAFFCYFNLSQSKKLDKLFRLLEIDSILLDSSSELFSLPAKFPHYK